ncbi:MAG: hypothetical protein CFE45_02745 [Burkholderiales bacterium PBB5]|nr:MAG: hypothetical protein CFE45_02745 [Burkholderiales bacterium PBB5]
MPAMHAGETPSIAMVRPDGLLARAAARLTRRPMVRAALAACACALWVPLAGAQTAASPGADPSDRLIDLRTGQATTPQALLAELRQADVVLLGELHDQPAHHARRAALLAALQGSGAVVVAEQLQHGLVVARSDEPLGLRLKAAGVDARGWDWPMHEPLMAAIDAAGLPLHGGNLPPALARRIAREGELAVPPQLMTLLRAAALPAPARAALDDELQQGHCGQLPAARLPDMRLAQRARDAAMWLALATSGGRPAVLLAGNGHVRLDHGVPQIALASSAGLRLVSVGFGALGDAPSGPYSVLWLTPVQARPDPCAEAMPAVSAAPAASAALGR